MATITTGDLITRAQTILQDTTDGGVRWPTYELMRWLNDAYRAIINARPDANSKSDTTFSCAVGTRQKLTATIPSATKLLDVVRNTASGSAKGAVRQIDRSILDDQRRTWHAETETVDIEHFAFDPRIPTEFLVYPPASSLARLEVVYSYVPTAHGDDATNETIKVDDSYANAILDYMLYRAYSKDAEYAANAQRAAAHYQAMQAALGTKTQADAAAHPMDQPTMVNPNQPT